MSPDTIASLQQVLRDDPALVARLHAASGSDEAAVLLAEAAGAKGVTVSAGEVAARMARAEALATSGELDDAALEAVAGGVNHGIIIASIFSFGLGCAATSLIYTAIGVPRCGT